MDKSVHGPACDLCYVGRYTIMMRAYGLKSPLLVLALAAKNSGTAGNWKSGLLNCIPQWEWAKKRFFCYIRSSKNLRRCRIELLHVQEPCGLSQYKKENKWTRNVHLRSLLRRLRFRISGTPSIYCEISVDLQGTAGWKFRQEYCRVESIITDTGSRVWVLMSKIWGTMARSGRP